jgi:hypothetical protein
MRAGGVMKTIVGTTRSVGYADLNALVLDFSYAPLNLALRFF